MFFKRFFFVSPPSDFVGLTEPHPLILLSVYGGAVAYFRQPPYVLDGSYDTQCSWDILVWRGEYCGFRDRASIRYVTSSILSYN